MPGSVDTVVLIVGGGPVGLTAAIELGWRGIPAILVNERLDTAQHPKCNSTNSRSMEHFRRLGIPKELHLVSLPPHIEHASAYVTSYCGIEFGRLPRPYSDWPKPEIPNNVSQMVLEKVLRQHAAKHVDVRFGCRLVSWASTGEVIVAQVDTAEGERQQVRARYLIDADGASSLVRRTLDLNLMGEDGTTHRAFMGGTMFSYSIRSPGLMQASGRVPTHSTWIINPRMRGLMFSQDGKEHWVVHYQVPPGVDWQTLDIRAIVKAILGSDAAFEIISGGPWTGGLAMVAERYQAGNVFLAGDAAHLFTPLGGMGMNTGIGDVMNLCWKIAAAHEGWAGPQLLASYDLERRPIAPAGARRTSGLSPRWPPVITSAWASHGSTSAPRRRPHCLNPLHKRVACPSRGLPSTACAHAMSTGWCWCGLISTLPGVATPSMPNRHTPYLIRCVVPDLHTRGQDMKTIEVMRCLASRGFASRGFAWRRFVWPAFLWRGFTWCRYVCIALALALAPQAMAQGYPDRPIRIVVPATPGGPTDVLARLVAAAPADGYTLLFGNTATLATIPGVSKSAGYDSKAFAAVAKVMDSYQVLVVSPTLPVNSVAELRAYARANPSKLNFSTAGIGNITHLSGELFKSRTGTDFVAIHHKSGAESLNAILGGQTHFAADNITAVRALLQENRLRAVAVTSSTRKPEPPDLPTMIEAGVADYVVTSFFGIVAPAGTPAAIVSRLNTVINEGLKSEALQVVLKRLGGQPSPEAPEPFQALILSDTKKWADIANSANLKIE